ncbi:RelA/SpoT domain protein [Methylophaga thiooxydans]|uniref:RelA/SpoT domain protein n=1 Tax=Methylophaga thiooxydans TaxID=392484 RepID=A0A0A0BHN4_9GAMM|nr:RelA/SpoT domain-containing protein [Methylophaga thiooxydans]KGM07461.1 RelA/SpoT domain protein [Methylophaga thiooxydans]
MEKILFEYSKTKVSRAGACLIDGKSNQEDILDAKQVLDNWRACHVLPLTSFHESLKKRLRNIDESPLVSQRLKRTPSILSKLERNPKMQLARMQDIGGIRVVAKTMKVVRELEDEFKKTTKIFTKVSGGKDYVNYPKKSGYRSVHHIFKCEEGFSIELQIRTDIQHAWATTVETMGTFLSHSLKSSEGPEEWLEFFALASSAFSILEVTPRVPGYEFLTDQETFEKLLVEEQRLNVLSKLAGFRVATDHIKTDKKKGHYHLISLDLTRRMANIQSFEPKQIELAHQQYSIKEEQVRKGENLQVVLVNSESISALKKAYPSYFLDSENFAKQFDVVNKKLLKLKEKESKRQRSV